MSHTTPWDTIGSYERDESRQALLRIPSIRSGQVEEHATTIERVACEKGLGGAFEYCDKARRMKNFEAPVSQTDLIAVRDQAGVRRRPHRIGFETKIRRWPKRKASRFSQPRHSVASGVGFASTPASAGWIYRSTNSWAPAIWS